MKKTVIICGLILAVIFTGCGVAGQAVVVNDSAIGDNVVAMDTEVTVVGTPNVSIPITETLEVEDVIANLSNTNYKKDEYSFNRVVDIETFVEYLYDKMPSCKFKVEQYVENYFDDYFGANISEYGYIVGTFEESFDMFVFSVSFVDNKIVDFSMTVNVPNTNVFEEYESFVSAVFADFGASYDMNDSQIEEFVTTYIDFESYQPNVYGNLENGAYINDVVSLSVIFDGGKDIQFMGVSYYFVASTLM